VGKFLDILAAPRHVTTDRHERRVKRSTRYDNFAGSLEAAIFSSLPDINQTLLFDPFGSIKIR
jgi:hypothetical protein